MSQQRVNANRQATQSPLVIWFEQLGKGDVPTVGGKNASLGEMVCHLTGQGVRVPDGFATTADAYWRFVKANKLKETIVPLLDDLAGGKATLSEVGSAIRRAFVRGTWPADLAETIASSYRELCRRSGKTDADVAVRSSATAEDLPDASFAGQQETFLNIRGATALLDACRRCYASLFTDRAISYRQAKGFDHLEGRAFDRRSKHGAVGPRQRRSDVLDRHRDRLRQGRHHQCRVGARRKRRARRRRSRRIPGLQAIFVRRLAHANHREGPRREGAKDDLRCG